MPDLYPSFEMPALTEQQEVNMPVYGKSWFFDFEKGDFAVDGAGHIKQTDSHIAWAHWCIKAVLTERFAHLAYGADYGCEIAQAIRQRTREEVEAEIERVITEALLFDTRTQMISNFSFEWVGDSVVVRFVLTPVVGTPERVEVKLNA